MKSTGYILNGIYYKKSPRLDELKAKRAVTDKEWDHDRQRENHRKDLLQPYEGGKPNPKFIEQYPKESKDYGFIGE